MKQHSSSAVRDNYVSVNSMIDFEVSKNLVRSVHGRLPSGSRTLLRLHRAMLFLIHFFRRVSNAGVTDELSQLALESYNDTLAQHHNCAIRNVVKLALLTLPTRTGLLKEIGNYSEMQLCKEMEELADVLQKVYSIIQQIYEKNIFLNLP